MKERDRDREAERLPHVAALQGGSGKTRIVQNIVFPMVHFIWPPEEEQPTLMVVATKNAQAKNISSETVSAKTLNRAALLGVQKMVNSNMAAGSKEKGLQKLWSAVRVLVMEEISMVSALLYNMLDFRAIGAWSGPEHLHQDRMRLWTCSDCFALRWRRRMSVATGNMLMCLQKYSMPKKSSVFWNSRRVWAARNHAAQGRRSSDWFIAMRAARTTSARCNLECFSRTLCLQHYIRKGRWTIQTASFSARLQASQRGPGPPGLGPAGGRLRSESVCIHSQDRRLWPM